MSLPTVDDLQTAVRGHGNLVEGELEKILDGAISFVRRYTRRKLEPEPAIAAEDPQPDPVEKRIPVHGSRFIRVPDAREVTQVLIDDVEETEYELHVPDPDGPATHIEVFTRGRVAKVTGRFGFVDVPGDLFDAILSLAARRVYERSIGYADAMQTSDWGGRIYTKQLPSPIRMTLDSYVVPDDRFGF